MHAIHVPDVHAAASLGVNSARAAARHTARQSTNEVLMVAPTAFTFNHQAAQDNTFMNSLKVRKFFLLDFSMTVSMPACEQDCVAPLTAA